MTEKLWQGRFEGGTAGIVEQFTASIDIDRRLYRYDIRGSIAHCRMLARVGVIGAAEADQLAAGLKAIEAEIEAGDFLYDIALEDIHMHIEARLLETVGPVAKKLHTARSRNDQIALDLRLYLRDAVEAIRHGLLRLQRVLIEMAKRHIEVVMPGYTHLQRAQPVRLSHHLMAYYEMARRDADRMSDCHRRINVMPLGAAALAGTTYPIDREYVAGLLGFPAISANSLDAVSDRDFVVEFLAAASLCMVHLSRFSEELILWSSAEFGFIELPDAFTTGSSIMPQKKNPDVAELVRGKTGGVIGQLVALLTTMKGLPLSYNRDLQEDKMPVFEAVDTLSVCLEIYSQMLPRISVNAGRMQTAAASGYQNATDLADYLVSRGMPFREAHHCAGRAVRHAIDRGKELDQLALETLQGFSELIRKDVYQWLSVEQVVDRRVSAGGTGKAAVQAAIAAAEAELAQKESEPA
jgi:argininosuccinate lyase